MRYFRKILFILLTIFAALGFVSCSTYDISKKTEDQVLAQGQPESIAHINARITGYYLFNTVPLITGDPKKEKGAVFFTDTVFPDNSVDMLTRKASELGATNVSDITLRHLEKGSFSLWIIWVRTSEATGNAVK